MPAIRAHNVKKSYKLFASPLARLAELATGGLSRRHNVVEALSDLSFELEAGQTLGVIGSNGAGKSSLLRLMAGITEPTAGTLEVTGRVSALMDLTAGFHPDFTGRANVAVKSALMGMSKEQERASFDQIVAFSELGSFIDQPVRTYSSGMVVRLGFAVAIAAEPDVLLIDEVLAVGDQHFQDKCIRRVREMKEEGKTIVFVSHYMKPIRHLCDKVLWLEQGRIVEQGTPAAVVDSYIDYARRSEPSSPDTPLRAGNRDAWIDSVRLFDIAGSECSAFTTGDRMDIEIHYDTRHRVTSPTFLVTFYRNDNVEIYSFSTKVSGGGPKAIEGAGRVALSIPALGLLSGSYEISVEIQDANGIRPYDAHYRLYRFQVRSQGEEIGLYRIDHQFHFEA